MKLSTLAASLAVLLVIVAPPHADARDKGKGKPAPATRELTGSCTDSDAAALWWSPVAPAIGQPLKIMAVGEGAGELALTDPKGAERVLTTVRHDGPPSSMTADFTPTAAGNHQLIWKRGGKAIACRKVRWRRSRRRRRRRWAGTSGRPHTTGITASRISIRPGSRRCSMRRSTSRWTSVRCTRRCAIRRATSSTATLAFARTTRRTRRRSRPPPTAPTCRISCARTSRGSSGCRSASATAIAATNRGRRAARRSTATTTRRTGRTRWRR